MSYFISPRERTEWKFDAHALAKEIQAQWPDTRLESSKHPAIVALSWTLSLEGSRIDGTLSAQREAVHLDGDVIACAAFAVWLRSKIPESQELIFYDEGYSNDVALKSGVTAAQVADAFINP